LAPPELLPPLLGGGGGGGGSVTVIATDAALLSGVLSLPAVMVMLLVNVPALWALSVMSII
jgi:hypothetical protein